MAAAQPNVDEIFKGTPMLSKRSRSVGNLPFQLPDPPMKRYSNEDAKSPFVRVSGNRSSPAYGFGAPAHGWGKYKVPNVRSRSAYLERGDVTPGAGTHEITPEGRKDTGHLLVYTSDRFAATSPDYSFGISQTTRWPEKRYTDLSHVFAEPYGSSHWENPGPTHKASVDVTKRQPPIISVTQKRAKSMGFWYRPTPGADEYKAENRHKQLNYREATWKIGTEPRGKNSTSCLINKVSSPPKVGPGSYTHLTSLLRNEHGRQW